MRLDKVGQVACCGMGYISQKQLQGLGTVDLFIISWGHHPTLFSALSSQLPALSSCPKSHSSQSTSTSIAPLPVSGVEVHPESGHRGVSTEKVGLSTCWLQNIPTGQWNRLPPAPAKIVGQQWPRHGA